MQDRIYFEYLVFFPIFITIVSNAQNTPFALSCNYIKRTNNHGGEMDATSR